MQNMNIRKSQGGFTLIELVIVIVILGILAAVAIPRFVDLTTEAQDATCDGIKGGVLSNAAVLLADNGTEGGGAVGSPAALANIHGTMTKDGWTATEDTGACTITATLDNTHTCDAITVPTELASDC